MLKFAQKGRVLAAALLMGLLIVAFAGCSAPASKAQGTPVQPKETGAPAQPEGQDLVIPVSDISDKALFIPVKADGVNMEVIAVQAPDGSIRTAFNTCQVCFDSGKGYYKQEGDELVCQNCGNRFPMDEVEVTKGGCNPVPIPEELKIVTAESITIPYDLLQQAKELFSKWKSH